FKSLSERNCRSLSATIALLSWMRDAVIPLVILLNCCKGKQTGTLTQQKAGRFVITYVLAVIRSLKAPLSVGKRRPGWFFGLK
ncbi:MAG: hypothetical protein MRQ05_06205, partial [Candidatus Midichloria mitochondrii]|nr:hypothetical protein [Candidatus Midichloria mitochondrii]